MQTTKADNRVRPKSYTYHTNLRWVYNRSALLQSEGKPDLRVSSPPEFKGERGVWTPEDMFVASAEMCLFATFIALAERQDLPLISYTSEADGLLELVDGRFEFTEIVVRPRIVVDHPDVVEQVELTLQKAHKHCLISNSMRTKVTVQPKIEILNVN